MNFNINGRNLILKISGEYDIIIREVSDKEKVMK